jgi:O-antigen/teichoic acid export membrane protein
MRRLTWLPRLGPPRGEDGETRQTWPDRILHRMLRVPEARAAGRAGARIGWGLGDQALSSLTNFLLGIVVARSVSATGFGAFGLAYSMFVLAVGVSRALISDPLMVRYGAGDHDRWRRGTSQATGAGLLLGLISGVGLVGTGLATAGTTGSTFVALGLTLPGLLLQDGWRYSFVADGRSHLAFLDDLLFLFLMAPIFAILIAKGDASAASLVFAWGASATVAGLAAASIERLLPDARKTLLWLHEEGDLGFRYVAEFVAVNGALQITMFIVVAFAGLAAVGSLRAGFLLFGPVLVIFQGSALVLVGEGVRILARAADALRRSVILLAGILAGFTVIWGTIIVLLPTRYGQAVLGRSWAGARALAFPLTVMFAASGAETAIVIGLRSLAAARQSLTARLIEAALTVLGGAIGALAAGAEGAAWGLAVVYWAEVGVWWWQFLKALDNRPPEPNQSERVEEATLPFEVTG